MKAYWLRIVLIATATSVVLGSAAPQAQAQKQTQAQGQADREEPEAAALPIVCLGMGAADNNSDASSSPDLSEDSAFWVAPWNKASTLMGTQENWKSLGLLKSNRSLLDRLNLAEAGQIDRRDRDESGDDQEVPLSGFDPGIACDALSVGVLASALLVAEGGGSNSPASEPNNPADSPSETPEPGTPIGQNPPPQTLEGTNPPKTGESAPIALPPGIPEPGTPTNPNPPNPNPPDPQPVPTPALLPGLIGFSVAAFRKHRTKQTTHSADSLNSLD